MTRVVGGPVRLRRTLRSVRSRFRRRRRILRRAVSRSRLRRQNHRAVGRYAISASGGLRERSVGNRRRGEAAMLERRAQTVRRRARRIWPHRGCCAGVRCRCFSGVVGRFGGRRSGGSIGGLRGRSTEERVGIVLQAGRKRAGVRGGCGAAHRDRSECDKRNGDLAADDRGDERHGLNSPDLRWYLRRARATVVGKRGQESGLRQPGETASPHERYPEVHRGRGSL
jgi:hypothetical protein